MSLRLISHVNADSDLIEAWLKYYLQLGVDSFHFVLHGAPGDNARLLSIKDSYPITIEDSYGGAFQGHDKKNRLDAVLARYTNQWLLLLDSDEFVEFPYGDIAETIRALESVNANVLFAPMLQRITADGSLETPSVIEHPFQTFPLCSVQLYRKMGVKGDIFKFPLFFCDPGTQLSEEGNHHPVIGHPPRATTALGVTHHFKFRRTVSQRLDQRINSTYHFRHESVQFREYLDSHSNRLPLDEAFPYSREELFRRRLLKRLPPAPKECSASASLASVATGREATAVTFTGDRTALAGATRQQLSKVSPAAASRKILFVLPKSSDFGGLERHLLDFLVRLDDPSLLPLLVCFDHDVITPRLQGGPLARISVTCEREPKSFREWLQLFRNARPDIVVFCYSWFEAFPWQAPAAAWFAGVRKRFSIQHLIPTPPRPPRAGLSPANLLRRLVGKRTRHLLGLRIAAHLFDKTICVSESVRKALVTAYKYPERKTITIRNGVSTSVFAPSPANGAALRAKFCIEPDEFVLVSAARLVQAKGTDILLHAVSRVLRQGVPCKCIIVGDGPLKETLIELANSLGLTGNVFFEGFQSDVRPYLQAGSAFILTSHLEGLPLSVLEAMACGLPCIVTDVGGSAEAVKDRVVGLVIPPGSLDDAENAILYLATHPRERAEMAAKTRETVSQSFDIEKSMAQLKHALLD